MSILEEVTLQKEKLNTKFSAKEQESLKSQLAEKMYSVIEDCRAYDQSCLSAETLEQIKANVAAGGRDYTHYSLDSMKFAIESATKSNLHLYDFAEKVINTIDFYSVSYSCKREFYTVEHHAVNLIHGFNSFLSGEDLQKAYNDHINGL